MSVYEHLSVEKTRGYTKKQIINQFKKIGCTLNPEQKDTFLSTYYKTISDNIRRIGFYIPCNTIDKRYYCVSSFNHGFLPQDVFEWVRRNFPKNTRICSEIENHELYHGTIDNYYRTLRIKKDDFDNHRKMVKGIKALHRIK